MPVGAPHSEQNLTRAEFSVPHTGHCMNAPSGPGSIFGIYVDSVRAVKGGFF